MAKAVFACSQWELTLILALITTWLTGCSPLALESGTRVSVTEQSPATVETGATSLPTDSGYPGPATVASPATIVPTVEETPPYLRATPKPITYSLESTADWLTYENSTLGFSLKYPETPPQVIDERGGEWTRVVISIRTGPTLPAVWANIAVIEISIYPNRDTLSLQEFVAQISREYGGLSPVEGVSGSEVILDNLLRAGAKEAQAFAAAGNGQVFYGAKHNGFIYLFVAGEMTASPEQDQVFKLLTGTLRFSAPR